MKKNKITINKPVVKDPHTLACSFSCPKKMNVLFREKTQWVKYNKDISNVPGSILAIPLLTNILPIAWASGIDVEIDEIDRDFLESAEAVKNAFQQLHPQLNFKGTIHAKSIVQNTCYSSQKSGQLFSGGVDSIATYIRRKEEDPALLSIWGTDVAVNNSKGWEKVKHHILEFSQPRNAANLFIQSNFRSMLRYSRISSRFSINWWGLIQHGYALLGLCAPLTHSEGLRTLYIPSSFSSKFPELPWGSHPKTDNKVKWGETSVIHDGYEITRQEKLGIIADMIRNEDPSMPVRVCYKSSTGDNCGVCEKCSRTIIGLLLEGIDPSNHGLPVNQVILDKIKHNLLEEKWKMLELNVHLWIDIANHVPLKKEKIPPEYDSFFTWIEGMKFSV
ncbi:hypothetical protein A6P54_16640 [Bacillus sp. MKU004]|jgi:hypothetical protein|nr:hypothetical protein A6P54_16640 [Bacillus sp. MKU004]